MSRKTAREITLKIIFEYAFQKENPEDLYNRYIDMQEDLEMTPEDSKYILQVINGVSQNLDAIDDQIKAHLKDWNFERISKVDLALLRLSIYEIMFMEDIPEKVSVNEAVELSKAYSEENSASFINGMLAEILKDIKK